MLDSSRNLIDSIKMLRNPAQNWSLFGVWPGLARPPNSAIAGSDFGRINKTSRYLKTKINEGQYNLGAGGRGRGGRLGRSMGPGGPEGPRGPPELSVGRPRASWGLPGAPGT